jgi:hypothetical protein
MRLATLSSHNNVIKTQNFRPGFLVAAVVVTSNAAFGQSESQVSARQLPGRRGRWTSTHRAAAAFASPSFYGFERCTKICLRQQRTHQSSTNQSGMRGLQRANDSNARRPGRCKSSGVCLPCLQLPLASISLRGSDSRADHASHRFPFHTFDDHPRGGLVVARIRKSFAPLVRRTAGSRLRIGEAPHPPPPTLET